MSILNEFQDLIYDVNTKYNSYVEAEDLLYNKVKPIVESKLELATCKNDLTLIKEQLRSYPMSGGKALLFRSIILKEEKLKETI